MDRDKDPRYALRREVAEGEHVVAGQVVDYADLPPSGAVAGVPARLVKILLKKDFFAPKTPGMQPIAEPSGYDFARHTEQVSYDDKNDLALWISQPRDAAKGYVVYFEGMAGHWGDLGTPSLIKQHVAKYPGMETSEGVENRDYRIKRIKALQEHGYGVIAVHLPGFGASKGAPGEKSYDAAVEELIRWMQRQKIAAKDTVILGASQGGASAVQMAKRLSEVGEPPRVLTLVATPLSTADCVMDAAPPPDRIKKYILKNQKRAIDFPFNISQKFKDISADTHVLVIAGERDWVVPYHHSEITADVAAKTGHSTRLVVDRGAEHSSIGPEMIVQQIDMARERKYNDEHRAKAVAKGEPGYEFKFTAAIQEPGDTGRNR